MAQQFLVIEQAFVLIGQPALTELQVKHFITRFCKRNR